LPLAASRNDIRGALPERASSTPPSSIRCCTFCGSEVAQSCSPPGSAYRRTPEELSGFAPKVAV
jgi:hypothetical protein